MPEVSVAWDKETNEKTPGPALAGPVISPFLRTFYKEDPFIGYWRFLRTQAKPG